MKRALLGFALVFSFVPSSLFPTSVEADDTTIQYLRVKYTTINNPLVQTASSPQEVTFTAYIQTDGYQLIEGDFSCNDNQIVVPAIAKQIEPNEFAASCTYNYDKNTKTGLRNIYMSTRYVPVGMSGLKAIPANAKIIYPIKEKDSFGQDVTRKTYAFDLYSRQSSWLGAPVAINPPQNFVYPGFPKNSEGFIIFDARSSSPVNFKVNINTKTKVFSASCADQKVLGLSNETRIYWKELIWGAWGPFPISTSKSVRTYPYLTSHTKGKNLDMSCSYFISLKNPIFAGIQVTYVESAIRSVQFPKK